MRLRLYQSLFLRIQNASEESLEDICNSAAISPQLLEDLQSQPLTTCVSSQMNDSYADHFILNAIQEMMFENGVTNVSQACLTFLAELMKSSIQNIGKYLRSAVLHFPIQSSSTSYPFPLYREENQVVIGMTDSLDIVHS